MSLIKSISGIRGTIGGKQGDGLGCVDIVRFTAAYATYIKENNPKASTIVVGRDGRISGPMVERLVTGTLIGMGLNVINIGKASTPTVEIAVTGSKAEGGIIITASHNPIQWNALKLLDSNGEFLNDEAGKKVIEIAEAESYVFADVMDIGTELHDDTWGLKHIEMVTNLDLVDIEEIKKANFTVVIDGINSVGGDIIPKLLKSLGVKNIIELNCDSSGKFAHTPEPIPENLTAITSIVKENGADVGFVVDPDVDRLAIVMENGEMFIEENTLVVVADYILSKTPGPTVSNLSSSRGLRDIAKRHGCVYNAAAVGEVNVVAKMKETGAVIGGEGNGGVIYPELHYGRDALIGIALFLTYLAKSGKKVSELKSSLPEYHISKNKVELTDNINIDLIFNEIRKRFESEEINDIDGMKIDFPDGWVHMRKSNTEPIIRIYSEAKNREDAEKMANDFIEIITEIAGRKC